MTDFPHDDEQPGGSLPVGSTEPLAAEQDDVPTAASDNAGDSDITDPANTDTANNDADGNDTDTADPDRNDTDTDNNDADPDITDADITDTDITDADITDTDTDSSDSDSNDPEITDTDTDSNDPDRDDPDITDADTDSNDPDSNDPDTTDTDSNDPANTGAACDGDDSQPAGAYPPPPFTAVPPGYAAAPPIRHIYRSRRDRKLGGVSAGIAEFFRIDPTIVRLATLVFAITGVGVLAYIAAWIIIPLRPEGLDDTNHLRPIGEERTIAIALGVAALALMFGIVTSSWAALAVALIGGGVWLLSQHPSPVAAAPSSYPPSAPTAPHAYAPQQTAAAYSPYAATGGFAPPTDYDSNDAPLSERRPQRVTWTVLSLLALLTAVGAAAATGDWWDVSATRFLGAAVVIIAVGVVVGQLRGGGARGLIPIGVLAALALFPVSAVDGLLDDGVGATTYRPTTIAELESSYAHGVGQLTVDLSRLDFAGRSETIDIDLGIGELIVIVSEDTGGHAVLQATAGEVSHQLPNTDSFLFDEGVNIESGTVLLQGKDGALELNLSVGFGTAELRSEPG